MPEVSQTDRRSTKLCRHCQRHLPLSDFYQYRDTARGGRVSRRARCRACDDSAKKLSIAKKPERYNAWHAAYRASYAERQWAYCLKRSFGMTVERYNEILRKQDGLCAICRRPPQGRKKRLSVDHCHETGAIRGLLCDHCNRGLGLIGDNIEGLSRAIAYLRSDGFGLMQVERLEAVNG